MKWLNYVILQQQHSAGILKDQLTYTFTDFLNQYRINQSKSSFYRI